MALWLLTTLHFYGATRERALELYRESARRFVEGVQEDLEQMAHAGEEDVLGLAAQTRTRLAHLEEVRRIFRDYATYRATVFQVRLLGPSGVELVRLERADDGTLHERSRLQDKSKRSYFLRASQLDDGQTYVSPVDPNIENGVVEMPLRPVIRFATPIRDDSNELQAIVVINQTATPFLQRVSQSRYARTGTLMLVHADGIYEADQHGDAIERRQWIEQRVPELSAWLAGQPAGGTRRQGDWLLVAGAQGKAPRAVEIAESSSAVAAYASEFSLFLLGALSTLALLVSLLFLWFRKSRLDIDLAREMELRREIESRQEALELAQERLVASARLAALSESAASLAHELRNPLGAIVHSAHLLRRDAPLDDDDDRLLEIVIDECERLERAVSSFLAMSRRGPKRTQTVDLRDIVKTTSELFRSDADNEGIDLQVARSERPVSVDVDPDEISQVLWNLLRNAKNAVALGSGHRIAIATTIEDRDDGSMACLSVEDDGVGLGGGEPEISGGSGLGLIVARGIAAGYSGTIELTALDQGVRAELWLPLADDAEQPAELAGPSATLRKR